jgi:hypothetical protein
MRRLSALCLALALSALATAGPTSALPVPDDIVALDSSPPPTPLVSAINVAPTHTFALSGASSEFDFDLYVIASSTDVQEVTSERRLRPVGDLSLILLEPPNRITGAVHRPSGYDLS